MLPEKKLRIIQGLHILIAERVVCGKNK